MVMPAQVKEVRSLPSSERILPTRAPAPREKENDLARKKKSD